MPNPMPNEKEIWERIEKEGLYIDSDIWDMINHYTRNALFVISSGWQLLRYGPEWILKVGSVVMTVLRKIASPKGASPQEIEAMRDIIQKVSGPERPSPQEIIETCDRAIDWEKDKSATKLINMCDSGITWTKATDDFLKKLHAATAKGSDIND